MLRSLLAVPWLRLSTWWMLLGALALLLSLAGRQVARSSAADGWEATDGVVVSSWIKPSADRSHAGHPVIVARYTAHRRDHRVTLIPAQGIDGAEGLEAAELVARYPEGAAIRVFYDPAQPQIATLNRRPDPGGELGGALVLLLTLAWVWRTDRQVQAAQPPIVAEESEALRADRAAEAQQQLRRARRLAFGGVVLWPLALWAFQVRADALVARARAGLSMDGVGRDVLVLVLLSLAMPGVLAGLTMLQ